MLFEVAARFASVTVKEGIQTRRSGINRLFTPSACLTLSRATILYLRLLSCYHIRSEVSDKCLCLHVFCPSLFAALSSNISFGSDRAAMGFRLIAIKTPLDLGLGATAAATAVQALW